MEIFDTAAAKNFHILDHFQQEICLKCDQNLLRIGENLYVLHGAITCIDADVKQESELLTSHADAITGIFHDESENIAIHNDDDTYPNKSDDLYIEADIKADSVENVSEQKIEPIKLPIQSKPSKRVQSEKEKESKRRRGRPRKCREMVEKLNEIGDNNPIFDDDSSEEFKKTFDAFSPTTTKSKRKRPRKKDTFFKCDHKGCGKIVKNRCKAAHIKTHTLKERFVCDICQTSLASKIGLRAHFDVHYPRREFKCHICTAEYKSLSSLNQHIRYIHQNEPKQFICTICGSAQRKRHLLWEHMNRHNGIKPYRCAYDGCEMRFFSKARRTEHARTHTGEKPYICDLDGCNNRFAYAVDFKRHKFKIHGIYTKKYNCTICSEILPENRLLKKHMETHHKQIG